MGKLFQRAAASIILLGVIYAQKQNELFPKYDHHVHILSPQLISDWKAHGVPFSKLDSAYTSISYIFRETGAEKIFLLSMAYLYGAEGFTEESEYEKVKDENNYLAQQVNKLPNQSIGFFSVNPLKEYAEKEIIRCADELNLTGIKLHFNNSSIELTSQDHLSKLKKPFHIISQKKLPVVLHLHNGSESFGIKDIKIFIDSILANLPELELYIAHLGTSGGYNKITEEILNSFIDYFNSSRMPEKQKIFFDISAVVLTESLEGIPKLNKDEFGQVSNKIRELGLKRVVFGSDYPVFNSREYLSTLKENLNLTAAEIQIIIENTGSLMKE